MTLAELEHSLGPGAYHDLVKGIRCQAEHDADLLADALCGTARPARRRPKCTPLPTGGWVSLITFLAAVLRLRQWRDKGHDRSFTTPPPDLSAAPEIVKCLSDSGGDESVAALARRFAVDVLVFWMANFSWSARRLLGVDVVLRNPTRLTAHSKVLTGFLNGNRRLALGEDGGNDAGA